MIAQDDDSWKLVRFPLGRGDEARIRVRRGRAAETLGPLDGAAVFFDADGVLHASPALPPAWRGLGLAAAFLAGKRRSPFFSRATFRTSAGPREVRRRGRMVHVEHPAPLVWRADGRRGTARDALRRLGLEPRASSDACFMDLDGVVLTAALPVAGDLRSWQPSAPVAEVLDDVGCCCLLLFHAAGGRILARSWLDDGRELPSPLAAGAAACLALADADRSACLVQFADRPALPVRLRRDERRIHRLSVGLRSS